MIVGTDARHAGRRIVVPDGNGRYCLLFDEVETGLGMFKANQRDTVDPVLKQFAHHRIFPIQIISVRGDKQGETRRVDCIGKGLNYFGKDGVVYGWNDQADSPAAATMHGLCRPVSDVSQPFNRAIDLFASRRIDHFGMVEAT